MGKRIIIISLFLGALGVGLGAFGTHALKSMLQESGRVDTYETAVNYHFLHALLLLGYGIIYEALKIPKILHASYLIIGGMILFSGSLYLLCVTNFTAIAYVTPIGGVLLILGWLLGAFSLVKQ